MLVMEALCATQNGFEDEVMELFNSLTFRRLYGGTAAQPVCCSIFGIDNADPPFFTPVFCSKAAILVDILQYY